MSNTPIKSNQGQLQRRLGLASAISITAGAVIGSGIFLKPLIIAQNLPSIYWIFFLWIALGLVCLCGALAYAELGALFPLAGGQYVFLREGWGREVAFLYGWVFFWAINSGTLAALATAFAQYLIPLLPVGWGLDVREDSNVSALIASAMILSLAAVNHYGVSVGALVQNLSTFAKLAAFGLIILGGVWMGDVNANTVPVFASNEVLSLSSTGLMTAFIGIFWAYEGWYQLPFNSAELKSPERNLPLGLIYGMLILMVAYLGINAIYLQMVPFEEMRQLPTGSNQQVPYLTVARIFSPQVANYLTLFVAISVMGAANPNILSSTRAFYAMGEDGLAPRALQWVHPRHGTPMVAIWAQALWAVFIVVYVRKFHDITTFVVFDSFLFYLLTVAAVYRLRQSRPELHRPYRCSGYPYTPAIFILVSIGFISTLMFDPQERRNALMGLVILAPAIPYFFWIKHRERKTLLKLPQTEMAE